jgi:hypothetical protein
MNNLSILFYSKITKLLILINSKKLRDQAFKNKNLYLKFRKTMDIEHNPQQDQQDEEFEFIATSNFII